MTVSKADIFQGNELLFSDIEVFLTKFIEPDTGLDDWYGYFDLPLSSPIEPGGPYRLVFKDGREGSFGVSEIQATYQNKLRIVIRAAGRLK